ncbi:MAG: c-type cytochrome [Bacteroidota bacterium]
MMKLKKSFYFAAILVGIGGYGFVVQQDDDRSATTPMENLGEFTVADVELELGGERPQHYLKKVDDSLANVGERLIREGKADYKDHKGKLISPYFNCTDCHNLKKEQKDATNKNPQDRLDYLTKNDMPFAPGSTFYGIYNRSSFYNGDYYKKYGSLVDNAKDTLENAVQLCAEYCASGRPLEQWELDAIMHYYKREELTIDDLDLSGKEWTIVENAISQDINEQEALTLVKTKYVHQYGATFTGAMNENKRLYGSEGDPENGEKIYRGACMFCHENSRVTYLELNDDILSARYLWRNKEGYDDESIYQVVRWGTYPITGRKQYMPLYTEEKMSDEQLEDLMAYIKELAKK